VHKYINVNNGDHPDRLRVSAWSFICRECKSLIFILPYIKRQARKPSPYRSLGPHTKSRSIRKPRTPTRNPKLLNHKIRPPRTPQTTPETSAMPQTPPTPFQPHQPGNGNSLHNLQQPNPLLLLPNLAARKTLPEQRRLKPHFCARLLEDHFLQRVRESVEFAACGIAGDVQD